MKSLRKKYKRIIESYRDTGDVQRFWSEQQAFFGDAPSRIAYRNAYEDDLSEYDREFFFEAFEVLYHTDFVTPADEYLHEPSYLMEWIMTNYPKYLDITWEKPFQEGPRWVEIRKADLFINKKRHKPLHLIFQIVVSIFILIIVWMAFKALFDFEGPRNATERIRSFTVPRMNNVS